jgi:hypothetical protein
MDDLAMIGKLVENINRNCYDCICTYQDFYSKVARHAFCGGHRPLSYEMTQQFNWICLTVTQKNMSALEDFNSLPLADQNELMRTNSPMITAFKVSPNVLFERTPH